MSGIALGLAIMVSVQVSPSGNMVCTVVGTGGLSCNGPGPIATRNDREKKSPQLLDGLFIVKPGAALDQPNPFVDCRIVGIARGDLVNEKAPFLHVSLQKDSVTLMPKEQPFRLRNRGPMDVKFRLIQIQR